MIVRFGQKTLNKLLVIVFFLFSPAVLFIPDADALYFASDHLPVFGDFVLPIENGVCEHCTEELLSDLVLSQNYPNPFNASTTIKFKLLHKSYVSVVIYNIHGSVVDRQRF
ncbi:MAG: hypothetical protein GF353_02095 [Candidatus Lokiarchaeota archaeon]|nr:hypothetical protein [Candidatus Lokiarchaeota archaeon]